MKKTEKRREKVVEKEECEEMKNRRIWSNRRGSGKWEYDVTIMEKTENEKRDAMEWSEMEKK